MATHLNKFNDAYATMTVATYEPLILKWFSGWAICNIATTMAYRLQKGDPYQRHMNYPTAQALNMAFSNSKKLPQIFSQEKFNSQKPPRNIINNAGKVVTNADVNAVNVQGFPNAERIGSKIYPNGVVYSSQASNFKTENLGFFARLFGSTKQQKANLDTGPMHVSTGVNANAIGLDQAFDYADTFRKVFVKLTDALATASETDRNVAEVLRESIADISGFPLFEFWPTLRMEEALSPIGVAHYYRQHYFDLEEGYGPIEEAFTIAPLETFEVVYQTIRRQIHEEIIETGLETALESSIESRLLEEVSDKVSAMIQRDSSASMSADASGTIGVWNVGASASADLSNSSQRGTEVSSRRLKDVTKRASERIRKSFSVKTRELDDLTTTNYRRRVIQNQSDAPVSYGLRRVLRKVQVKVQDLGPRVVWQAYVKSPGRGLARSEFVHFREADEIAAPDIPPGVRPRPKGGTDVGSTSTSIDWDIPENTYFVPIVVQTGSDRKITGVSIDSITDLEGGGKNDQNPSAQNNVIVGVPLWDGATNTFAVNIGVVPGDSRNVSVSYTYTYEPSQALLNEWESERSAAVNAITEELLNQKFEREKTIITEKSRIPKRPANELRKEERYEVLNRMVSELFGRGDDPSDPAPLEIEYFHRYFDIEGIFVTTHPSWWKPRYSPVTTGYKRKAYEITADSDPAPLGKSLGWMVQEDGDNRRNEFINSPWVRVCIPIRPDEEEDAISWLSTHVEGTHGYNTDSGPLKDLLDEVKAFREREGALGIDGPDYVQVSSTVGAPPDPATPAGVYPIINEFDVVVPTEGFVYDELTL